MKLSKKRKMKIHSTLSNNLVQGKNENSVEIIFKLAELVEINNFHRNQIDVGHWTSKNKMASIIVLFH